MSVNIGVFHLLTSQEGNLRSVHKRVYRLGRGRDVVGLHVHKGQHTPRDPSDMSNLEFKAPTNIDQRGMLFERVPPTLRGG